MNLKYKRILLKLSGEALKSSTEIYDGNTLSEIANQIIELTNNGLELGIVVGGGNIWRGNLSSSLNLNQIDGDYMGMMATVMNAIALRASLEAQGFSKVIIYSALEIPEISAKYNYHEAREKLSQGYVVIFGGGTGHALFTTDTAAALRAIEIKADALLMAKNGVAGVYDSDPKTNPDAKFLEEIHYDEIFMKDLKVMDVAAATLAKKGNLLIEVFDMQEDESLLKIVEGKITSTKIN